MNRMFCSRDPAYRNPVGALAAGENLHLRLRLPRSFGCRGAYLSIRVDGESGTSDSAMYWCGMDGYDHEWWECDYRPTRTGVYWYCFRLNTNFGPRTLCKGARGVGQFQSTDWFQLTVYDPDFRTPDWLSGGVIYQIFPDRFNRSNKPKQDVPGDRIFHLNRWEQPEWQPDASGEYENNDYFGGDLQGITEKLDYLQSLGVTCLYLNPIFEAHSNHRYNTADYEKIDPLLGTEEDLKNLCDAAKARGMHVLLDGVFNHTGSDSRYFNRNDRYPECGAFQSLDSPYADWFDFTQWPTCYASWWGFQTLPVIRHDSTDFQKYITDPGGISDKWIGCGTSGWRLDVVDELSDPMLDALRIATKRANPDALLLGEVWEDASNKVSYNRRRHYLLGQQLDSVMNYPFRKAILEFFAFQDANRFAEIVESIVENYPPQVTRLLMNMLGTHDTERALTALGGERSYGRNRVWQSTQKMTPLQRMVGLRRLRAAAAIQYCLPGVPSLYYGDETGMEGYRDPFNRGCYPWGREDQGLVDWFRRLGALRSEVSCLREGAYRTMATESQLLAFERVDEEDRLLCICNAGMNNCTWTLPAGWGKARAVIGKKPRKGVVSLDPISCTILVVKHKQKKASAGEEEN